jgi:hypothetical protein
MHQVNIVITKLKNQIDFLESKGAGIFLHKLQLYDSFRQKCSKLDTFTA